MTFYPNSLRNSLRNSRCTALRRAGALSALGLSVFLMSSAIGAQTLVGDEDFRISFAGPDGSKIHDAAHDGIAYDSKNDRYLVVWDADDRIPGEGATFNGKREVFGRLLDADGGFLGDTRLIASSGPAEEDRWDAENPEVVYNSLTGEFMAVWVATVAASTQAAKQEIFAMRLSAAGAPIGTPTRVTRTGADSDLQRDSKEPSLAFNAARNEVMVVWQREQSDRNSRSEQEIYAQRISGTTAALLGPAIRVSSMGPNGATSYDALDPDVAWAAQRDEYLVVWRGDDDRDGLVNGEFEIFGQRLSGTGSPIGADDVRISRMGPNGNPDFDAEDASVAYNPDLDEWMVGWTGLDDLDAGEEIYAQLLSGTLEPRGEVIRVSSMGPEGALDYRVDENLIRYNAMEREYMVIWMGEDDRGLMVPGEWEVFGQRLDENGVQLGVDDVRISSLGPDGDSRFDAFSIGLEVNTARGESLVVFSGDDDRAGQVDDEVEIFGQRVLPEVTACVEDLETVCLTQGRFAVSVDWLDGGTVRTARANRLSGDTSWFWFFEETNVELVVKVLDARGVNGRHWVFFGALSDVEYVIDVFDTQTGERQQYRNQKGTLASRGDTSAFPVGTAGNSNAGEEMHGMLVDLAGSMEGRAGVDGENAATEASTHPCVPGETTLCLNNDRFRLEVDWKTAQVTGVGQAVELTRDTGWFWFFDPANTELVVKVLDARGVNGAYWVYFGSLSDVEYSLRVTDTERGVTRVYDNPQGTFASVGDVNAFPQ